MNDDENSVPRSKQIECYGREQAVWDKIVNDFYKAMMDGLEPGQQQKLKAMQRSWIHTRDLTCAFWYDYFEGSMANPMMALVQQPRDRTARNLSAHLRPGSVAAEMIPADNKAAPRDDPGRGDQFA